MAGRVSPGDKLPFFRYDTPYSAQNWFRDLLAEQAPLILVFINNFGHPVTRTFAMRYADTYAGLRDGGFALVVRSRADQLARVCAALCAARLEPKRAAFVRQRAGEAPWLVLVEGQKNRRPGLRYEPDVLMEDEGGRPSARLQTIYREGM